MNGDGDGDANTDDPVRGKKRGGRKRNIFRKKNAKITQSGRQNESHTQSGRQDDSQHRYHTETLFKTSLIRSAVDDNNPKQTAAPFRNIIFIPSFEKLACKTRLTRALSPGSVIVDQSTSSAGVSDGMGSRLRDSRFADPFLLRCWLPTLSSLSSAESLRVGWWIGMVRWV